MLLLLPPSLQPIIAPSTYYLQLVHIQAPYPVRRATNEKRLIWCTVWYNIRGTDPLADRIDIDR